MALTAESSDLLDRVRRLLALATSSNVHEAAAAAARAQALITRHALDLALLHPAAEGITDGAEAPLERARKLRPWRLALASALAQLNGCVAYRADGPEGQEIRLAGRAEDREATRALWSWLSERIQWLSATEGAGHDRAWHEAFRIGAVEVAAARLAEARAAAQDALDDSARASSLPALVAREDAVAAYVEEHLNLRTGRGVRVDPHAYTRGRRAAAKMDLGGR